MLITDMITGITTEIEDIIVEPILLTPEQIQQQYKDTVVSLIREKYTADDEFAILRKNMAGIDETEFVKYNSYVESCKVKIKAELDYKN
jgi:hypothetical protein